MPDQAPPASLTVSAAADSAIGVLEGEGQRGPFTYNVGRVRWLGDTLALTLPPIDAPVALVCRFLPTAEGTYRGKCKVPDTERGVMFTLWPPKP